LTVFVVVVVVVVKGICALSADAKMVLAVPGPKVGQIKVRTPKFCNQCFSHAYIYRLNCTTKKRQR
jgi:hypothetical protein